MAIPGGQFLVPDGPVHGDAVLSVGFKVEVAPAVRLPAPHQRPPAYLVAPEPIEGLNLHVRAFFFVDPKIQVAFVQGVVPLQNRVVLYHLLSFAASVRKLPGALVGVDVVFDVLNVAPPLQHDCFQPFFRQFFSRPSARNTRTNNDGIIRVVFHKLLAEKEVGVVSEGSRARIRDLMSYHRLGANIKEIITHQSIAREARCGVLNRAYCLLSSDV